MIGRSRIKKNLDFNRLGEAVSRPGIDPRPWLCSARVDDDPDAISFIEGTGWVVDVTVCSGPLSGEGPIPCRVASSFGEPNGARLEPVKKGAEVTVLFLDGDPNSAPIIVGYAFNPEDMKVPATVNGETINEAFALENHILVTPHGVKEEVRDHQMKATGDIELDSGTNIKLSAASFAYLLAQQVRFADENATEPFVRGNKLVTALSSFLSALTLETGGATGVAAQLVSASQVSPPGPYPNPLLLAAATQWQAGLAGLSQAIAQLNVHLLTPGDVTSLRIKGE